MHTSSPPAHAPLQPLSASHAKLSISLSSLAWLLLPVTCHIGFSWIGFNPTDDGWLQAVARRIADGQLPHRDFIFVRPALSAVFQVPLVWWGGDLVIWLARLWGWVTLGAVCWIWSGLLLPESSLQPRLLRHLLYSSALLLCAHSFPVMAWHTIDGMLLCSIAVMFASRGTPRARAAAFFFAGLAVLCRQNFGPFAPLLLIALGLPSRGWVAAGMWSALPAAIYTSIYIATGSLDTFLQQIWSTSGAFHTAAIKPFLTNPHAWGGIVAGALAGTGVHLSSSRQRWPWLPGSLFALACTGLVLALWKSPMSFHLAAYALFGMCTGLVLVALWHRPPAGDRLTMLSALALGWTTTISLGYNSPALMSGVLLMLAWKLLHPSKAPAPSRTSSAGLVPPVVALASIAVAFSHARQTFPYCDRPAAELRSEAGEVLAGARHLRTNAVTFEALSELQALTAQCEAEGRPYAILTDCAAYWIRSSQPNLLPCEWPQETELGFSPDLHRRLIGALEKLPPNTWIIVQRHLIAAYAWGIQPVPPDAPFYFTQNWLARQSRLLRKTNHFSVFAPPPPRS